MPNNGSYRMNEPNEEMPLEIDVAEVSALQRNASDFLLLDVREPDEHATARIEGALLVPMSQLRERIGELEPHRQRRVVVHCHHGGRSLRVVHALRERGFDQAQNMAGGIDAWSLQVDPQVPRY